MKFLSLTLLDEREILISLSAIKAMMPRPVKVGTHERPSGSIVDFGGVEIIHVKESLEDIQKIGFEK
jgi:hypothetical protein